MCQREMTLDEWVGKLATFHRAVKELAALRAENERLRAVAEAVVPYMKAHGCSTPVDTWFALRDALAALDAKGGTTHDNA